MKANACYFIKCCVTFQSVCYNQYELLPASCSRLCSEICRRLAHAGQMSRPNSVAGSWCRQATARWVWYLKMENCHQHSNFLGQNHVDKPLNFGYHVFRQALVPPGSVGMAQNCLSQECVLNYKLWPNLWVDWYLILGPQPIILVVLGISIRHFDHLVHCSHKHFWKVGPCPLLFNASCMWSDSGSTTWFCTPMVAWHLWRQLELGTCGWHLFSSVQHGAAVQQPIWGNVKACYTLSSEKLGEGGFGYVTQGRSLETGNQYAVKKVSKALPAVWHSHSSRSGNPSSLKYCLTSLTPIESLNRLKYELNMNEVI